ncbi:MAG TPA: DUF1289 domain-containing protein [Hyphomicrobiaceae bacterium]|jgi:predicted Fe-S protein YdhL (DUF1289 family)|nr:DUF1289 domain-containing protein [Hyphomicrobiaceae bacterium]
MDQMESPCTKVCIIDPASGLCRGCKRTLTEIACWASLTAAERRRVMLELPARQGPRKAG